LARSRGSKFQWEDRFSRALFGHPVHNEFRIMARITVYKPFAWARPSTMFLSRWLVLTLAIVDWHRAMPAVISEPRRDTADWARTLDRGLRERILPYWLNKTVDRERGGFLLADDLRERRAATQKQLVGQSRMIWGFAQAHRQGFGGNGRDYLRAADQGYRFLIEHFLDRQNGGYFWTTDLDGKPFNDSKILYGQSFVIYGLVEYYRASTNRRALDRALELYRTIQDQAYDRKQGGWVEHFQRDWQPILSPEAPAEVEIAGLKSANTHLHLMEAFTELYEVSQDPQVKDSLAEALRLNQTWFYPNDPGQSAFHRHPDGRRATGPRSDGLSYGHNVEFAWLMIRAQKVLGQAPDWDHFHAHLQHALRYGYDHELGGLYNKGFNNQPANDTEKVWWVQAELIAALTDALQHQPRNDYKIALLQTLQFVETHLADPTDGIWIASVTRYGAPKWTAKAHDWKANYHDVRALVKFSHAFLDPRQK
jgi:mannose/cellobiose epimerase-like protein (N-acyl-D-glucosamine 2-epimerase family)